MVLTVLMHFFTVLKQKSKVRLICEISEFSYLGLGHIRKLGNVGKIFLTFRSHLNLISMICIGSNFSDAFLDCFKAKEQS